MEKSPERFATPHTLSDCQFCWDTLFVLFNVIGLFETKIATLYSQWQVAFWLIDSFLSTWDPRSSIGIVNHSICYTDFLVHPRWSPDFTVFLRASGRSVQVYTHVHRISVLYIPSRSSRLKAMHHCMPHCFRDKSNDQYNLWHVHKVSQNVCSNNGGFISSVLRNLF